MADATDQNLVVRKEPEELPARDPIVSRSTSGAMLICALLLIGVLAWSLYDEAFGQRPWKGVQREFVSRYTTYLKKIRPQAKQTESEVKESAEYNQLTEEARAAQQQAEPRKKEIDAEIARIDDQLNAITDPFQNARGQISVINYNIENASSKSARDKLVKEREDKRQEKITVVMPADDGTSKTKKETLTFPQIEERYNGLKDQKAKLLGERAELLKEPSELAKKRDAYMKENMVGLSDSQIGGLISKNEKFDFSLRQINVASANIVDRCETCHLGTREPVKISPTAFVNPDTKKPDELSRAFASHPSKELLQIHDPERFGCSSCHGGNGRATTSVEKAHGLNPFWLHPLHGKENVEAGCQQCHTADRVLDGAPTLTLGKDLFQQRGCVGCHRSENFDRETDALAGTRQTMSQLEEEIMTNQREARQDEEANGQVADTEEGNAEGRKLLAHAEALRVTNSQIAARIDQLNEQTRYLMQDQKKVGPNLKDVRLKLVKEWIPIWLKDPQKFRPGTKMPTFWRFSVDENGDDEIKAISAYLWQEGFDGKVPDQQMSDPAHGEELFKTRGCMACHSIGEGSESTGGTFAANLTRVGEKANFEYIVRWIYNPRQRWAPYCPKEKRDLTREDYANHNLDFVFDTEEHSKCPNDGAELQVQNMTVMPNFRLSETDARDIASYLFSLSQRPAYPDASFMDDANLKETGRNLIKQYGCAGCHEIRGFEEEQRIGKELTAEGSTPIERLDFAMMTRSAEDGVDPVTGKNTEEWYNHRGFFEHKLATPWIYDKGKEKEAKDRLRMPQPFLTDEWRNALTTFLLGSVGTEGANVPTSLFYNPNERQKDIQDGWWVIKKYNCMGCHSVQVGQRSVLMDLPLYQESDWRDQLPPRLTSEGARVDPNWLLRFLHDPSLSGESGKPEPGRSDKIVGNNNQNSSNASQYAEETQQNQSNANANAGANANANANSSGAQTDKQNNGAQQVNGKLQSQPGADRNGVRVYLKARMPTFNFSPNELRTLVRFFMAVSAQQEPYIKQPLQPLDEQERALARQMFTSGTPCLKCHITGDPAHDAKAIAPNFLLASERLKPDWTYRWILDPAQISPGTAMPSGLFKKDGDRWVLNVANPPPAIENYHGDHADLLVRYMFLMTPDEQRRLMSTSPQATAGSAPKPKEPPASTTAHATKASRNTVERSHGRKSNALRAHAPRNRKLARAPAKQMHAPGTRAPAKIPYLRIKAPGN